MLDKEQVYEDIVTIITDRVVDRLTCLRPIKISEDLNACPTCGVGVFKNVPTCRWCKQALKWD